MSVCDWSTSHESEKNMKTVLVLLLAVLLGLSEAEYRRTVSYEGLRGI